MKYHIGPVSRTTRINKMMALDTMVAGKLGIDLPSSRLESYQIFSTADRCVNVFQGEKIARAMKAGNCNPDSVRRRRAEVRTGFQTTINRPCRFSARANAPSSAQ